MLIPRMDCLVMARLPCLVTAWYANAAAELSRYGTVVSFNNGTVCKCRNWGVTVRLSCVVNAAAGLSSHDLVVLYSSGAALFFNDMGVGAPSRTVWRRSLACVSARLSCVRAGRA